jgi:regulatory protein
MNHLVRCGYPAAVAEVTLEKLRSLNYINDESFARTWASSKLDSRGHGPRRIAHDLRTKGITEPLIREVLRELFEPKVELKTARLWLQKRFKGTSFQDPKSARRAAAFLQSQGYSGDVISDLINHRLEDE